MQTKIIRDQSVGTPWLERFVEDKGSPVRTYLEKLPFTIGRQESADLQIESNRVSREHAAIYEKSRGIYCLRDLKSTNGTFVNGQRIQEIELQDGDLVAVADFEMVFSRNRVGAQPYTQTQMMTEGEIDQPSRKSTAEFLQCIRQGSETLLEGVGSVKFESIFELGGGGIAGYEALISPIDTRLPGANTRRALFDLDCRLSLRLRHVDRLLALEEGSQLPHDGPIMFRLTDAESSADLFPDLMCAFEHLTDDAHRIVFAIPYKTAKADHEFQEKVRRAANSGIGLAVYDFPIAGSEVFCRGENSPIWTILEPGVSRGLSEHSQSQKELRAISAACREAGNEIVVVGIRSTAEAELCRDCGCRLGQGSWRVNVNN
jgi:pSer/pThr/pTyr-binding forkhead associated (FHA) protein